MYYQVYARRYSKNGNKTYSFYGFMTEEQVRELMEMVYKNNNSIWVLSIDKRIDK